MLIKSQPSASPIASPTVLTTLYSFPSLEPVRFAPYPTSHLALPLRRDILHRAVIFEGDRARQGTGSTLHRSEVHGSGRKIRPQKGTGMARLGDKKSPMLRGGGRAFPKKPRNFETDLPRKMYDLAFRTALSWRWRKGELVVVDGKCTFDDVKEGHIAEVFEMNGWGREEGGAGRSLVITEDKHERGRLFFGLNETPASAFGKALERWDVDVKDLLKGPRVIIEKWALDRMLAEHQMDLTNERPNFPWKPSGSAPAKSGLTLLK
ncbi:MAG: 54S ribosomal protein, mitochondrial [Bathelium mastoideum]|nr:MAG: 54S ribosomal protein, mitochondrial [Bathelium mastoideum]